MLSSHRFSFISYLFSYFKTRTRVFFPYRLKSTDVLKWTKLWILDVLIRRSMQILVGVQVAGCRLQVVPGAGSLCRVSFLLHAASDLGRLQRSTSLPAVFIPPLLSSALPVIACQINAPVCSQLQKLFFGATSNLCTRFSISRSWRPHPPSQQRKIFEEGFTVTGQIKHPGIPSIWRLPNAFSA